MLLRFSYAAAEVADAAARQPHLIAENIGVLGELIAEAHGLK